LIYTRIRLTESNNNIYSSEEPLPVFKIESLDIPEVDIKHEHEDYRVKSSMNYLQQASVDHQGRVVKEKSTNLLPKPKRLQCTYCNKSYKKPYELRDHMVVHTGDKPYQCDICHKSFAYRRTLWGHSKLHERDEEFGFGISEDSCTKTNNSIVEEDLKDGMNEEILPENLNQCSGDIIQVEGTPIKPTKPAQHFDQDSLGRYICPHCPQVFLMPKNLQEHLETHTDLNNAHLSNSRLTILF